jgi:glycosyltransferase involved in cell wall biosynthesis
VLVTTPDMLDFLPAAAHMPFFAPQVAPAAPRPRSAGEEFVVVHITNQPGIEGTRHVEAAIERLRARGHRIRLVWLCNRPHEEVLAAAAAADLAVGKLKMGYYANAQIETMALGVPTITHVRDAFMTEELRQSGFIFATPATLEATIEHYLTHPEELVEKRARARASILRLHDNDALARRYARLYDELIPQPAPQAGRPVPC